MFDTFWKIEESLSGGLYFPLLGNYETKKAANRAMANLPKGGKYRVVKYRTGESQGPVRVED